ncbi:hypothetical protein SLA2020_026910 [Shorea laevis]
MMSGIEEDKLHLLKQQLLPALCALPVDRISMYFLQNPDPEELSPFPWDTRFPSVSTFSRAFLPIPPSCANCTAPDLYTLPPAREVKIDLHTAL